MEDYILREIDKIGKLIEALLTKLGVRRGSDGAEEASTATKLELSQKLDLDIDALLAEEDFPAVLVGRYGFSEENLEKFAELLFDMVAAAEDRAERQRLAAGIGAIYCYLDAKKAPPSLNRYYILRDLNDYIKEPR